LPSPDPMEFYGAPASPYTRKMLAIMRYRRIPHSVLWGNGQNLPDGYPKPKVMLLPTFFFRDERGELEATTDSTPIIRRLEKMSPDRSIIPSDPALAFLNYIIEDYADEWLTKAMMHYRWAYQQDIDHARRYLVYMSMPTIDAESAENFSNAFAERQTGRLSVVGSNETTTQTIETSYQRLVSILDPLIEANRFVLGARPSSADFALYGQLTQLAIIDPTAAAQTTNISMRVRAWVDTTDDLSGLKPTEDDWLVPTQSADLLRPLLSEIGRVYAPFLVANAAAFSSGEKSFETEIDGRPWTQSTFPYQVKCLKWIRDEYAALSGTDRDKVDDIMSGTGCEILMKGNQ